MTGTADIVLLAIIVAAAAAVIVRKVRKVKRKGFGCDCGCGSCNASGCLGKKNERYSGGDKKN